jgi:2-oxoglutarate ferredoxin oxidoreductase subunit alpha
MNLGQLRRLVRAEFLVDAQGLNKMTGQPFRAGEIERALLEILGVTPSSEDTSIEEIE